MAKRKEVECVVEYTEDCQERLTEALLDIYYQRKARGTLEEFDKLVQKQTTA